MIAHILQMLLIYQLEQGNVTHVNMHHNINSFPPELTTIVQNTVTRKPTICHHQTDAAQSNTNTTTDHLPAVMVWSRHLIKAREADLVLHKHQTFIYTCR